MVFRPQDVDLADLASSLERALGRLSPPGYREGKTTFRDLVVRELQCSELEAELVVDTMVERGFLRFTGDPAAPVEVGVWRIHIDL